MPVGDKAFRFRSHHRMKYLIFFPLHVYLVGESDSRFMADRVLDE